MRRKVVSKQSETVKEDLTSNTAKTLDEQEKEVSENLTDGASDNSVVTSLSKRGKKTMAKNGTENNFEVESVANKIVFASRRGKNLKTQDLDPKQSSETKDLKEEIPNGSKEILMDNLFENVNSAKEDITTAPLKRGRKKLENKISSNGIESDIQKKEAIILSNNVEVDPLSIKYLPKLGRKQIKKSKEINKPENLKKESDGDLQESIEEKLVQLEDSSTAGPKENENDNEAKNVAPAKRGRKKKTSNVVSKEIAVKGASSHVQQQSEKEKETIEEENSSENDFQPSSHQAVKNKKSKTSQKNKEHEDIEGKNLKVKGKKDALIKNADQNDKISLVDNNAVEDVSVSTRGRKRKNKNENIAAGQDVKLSNQSDQNSDKVKNDSTVLTKEVKVVLKRQKYLVTDTEKHLSTAAEVSSELEGKPKIVAGPKGRATKRGNEKGQESLKEEKPAKVPKKADKSSSKKEKIPDVSVLDFSSGRVSASGSPWNYKISSWNVNGIRAWLEKDGISYLHHEKPDIMCVQETKCSDDKLPDEVKNVEDYHTYWLAGDKEGYSGVGLLSKEEPISIKYGIEVPEHDSEGRVITAEYEQFYLVAAYVPNAGRGLVRLNYRMKWDKDFTTYLKDLDQKKPVILTGDLNVAHEEIDLANPKSNKKNAGFTVEEREGFSSLLKEGFVDSFRHLYPDVKGAYTFWTYMMNARAKNAGWRLDYFVISKRLDEKLCDSVIRKDVFGSDHCPITLFLSL